MNTFDYYNFRIRMVTDSIRSELAFYESPENPGRGVTEYSQYEYSQYLRKRVGIEESSMVTHFDMYGNRQDIKKMDMDSYVKDIDQMMFNKPWPKLQLFHKTMKIKEFVDGLVYGPKVGAAEVSANRERIKQEIVSGLSEKRFVKGKSTVTYDQELLRIQAISCLELNKRKGVYEVVWIETKKREPAA